MAEKIDAFLKLSIVVAILLASSSVAYYYVIYLPNRDARIDADNAAATQRRAEEQAAAEQRRSEEEAAAEERRAGEKYIAQTRYNQCLRKAQDAYQSTWASNCTGTAQRETQQYASCMENGLGQTFCGSLYPRDPSPHCSLPKQIAEALNADINKARELCLQESKSGL